MIFQNIPSDRADRDSTLSVLDADINVERGVYGFRSGQAFTLIHPYMTGIYAYCRSCMFSLQAARKVRESSVFA